MNKTKKNKTNKGHHPLYLLNSNVLIIELKSYSRVFHYEAISRTLPPTPPETQGTYQILIHITFNVLLPDPGVLGVSCNTAAVGTSRLKYLVRIRKSVTSAPYIEFYRKS
jgi:hypothetical protein